MIDLITRHFNLEEIRSLCFELGVPFDALGGQGLSSVARELLLYMQRRDRLPELLAALREARPSVAWPDAGELAPMMAEMAAADPASGRSVGGASIQTGDITDSYVAMGQGASIVIGQPPRRKKRKDNAP